ncbi:hypothetical protein LUZ61_015522 [Rhynchospora tenuis]|uniref:Uncharacterized protein n=1 Tax=Rhynchospora tenuis TaxID=198213 RepID=A0AAD6EIU5_9POAL|nr:hypothetical protein LUZ61_015522 [Rhynchospora tenuis]
MWRVGTGENIMAKKDPWFHNWFNISFQNTLGQSLKVKHLINANTLQWDENTLRKIFDPQIVQHILHDIAIHRNVTDTLLWHPSKTGRFITKMAYIKFMQEQQYHANTILSEQKWIQLWKSNLPPRIKTFLWRGVHDALPTAKRLNRVIPNVPPICNRCGDDVESIDHMLFYCPSSRATWFASKLAIRVEDLPQGFIPKILYAYQVLNDTSCKFFFSLMWQIWKARCDLFFKGTKYDVRLILLRADGTVYQRKGNLKLWPKNLCADVRLHIAAGTALVMVDGSWDISNKMGLAAVCYSPQGNFYNFFVKNGCTHDAFSAEALAMLNGIKFAKALLSVFEAVVVFSDSKILVDCINDRNLQEISSWRAEGVIWQCIYQLMDLPMIQVRHARRDALHPAHQMANAARRGVHWQFDLSGKFPNAPCCFVWDPA